MSDATLTGTAGLRTRLHASLAAFVRGDYARGFFLRVLGQTFAVIVLIEAIFLAEHFTWVFKDAVRHEADLFGIWLILACTSTEIFDLALAIAILMAAYATLLRIYFSVAHDPTPLNRQGPDTGTQYRSEIFAATPEQDARRPAAQTRWKNLVLAGDWTRTGLPATIEGALRSGETAAAFALRHLGL